MSRNHCLLAIVVFIISVILASMWSYASPLCAYVSPKTDISQLGMSFAYDYHKDPYGLSEHDIDYGQLKINYGQLVEGLSLGYEVNVDGKMEISSENVSSFLVSANGSFKYYFSDQHPYFGFAGIQGVTNSSYDKVGVFANIGIGYGRFNDVTPLVKAKRIDEYLVKHDVISRDLPQIDVNGIAYRIDDRNKYDSDAELLAEIQGIVEGSGLARQEGLSALDIYRITETVEDSSITRYCGGTIRVGVGYEISDPTDESNDLLATISLDYAFAATPKEQFLVRGTFSSSYDILNTYRCDLQLAYDYDLTDFLTVSSAFSFLGEIWNGEPRDTHNVTLDVQLKPLPGANVTFETQLRREPEYLEWGTEISIRVGIDLL